MSEHDPDKGLARADLFRFVSACYYEPAPEFAEERLFDSMHTAALLAEPALAEPIRRLGEAFAADDLQTLLIDYTRLFLGPVQPLARPYGSFWRSGETPLMQDSTMTVLDLYRQGGFEMDEAFRELPDHVAVELEFVYLLGFRQHQARLAGDAEALARVHALRQRFLHDHLAGWIVPFTTALQAGAQTAFYRALAEVTAGLLQAETGLAGAA